MRVCASSVSDWTSTSTTGPESRGCEPRWEPPEGDVSQTSDVTTAPQADDASHRCAGDVTHTRHRRFRTMPRLGEACSGGIMKATTPRADRPRQRILARHANSAKSDFSVSRHAAIRLSSPGHLKWHALLRRDKAELYFSAPVVKVHICT